jgi:hypothetical protein
MVSTKLMTAEAREERPMCACHPKYFTNKLITATLLALEGPTTNCHSERSEESKRVFNNYKEAIGGQP